MSPSMNYILRPVGSTSSNMRHLNFEPSASELQAVEREYSIYRDTRLEYEDDVNFQDLTRSIAISRHDPSALAGLAPLPPPQEPEIRVGMSIYERHRLHRQAQRHHARAYLAQSPSSGSPARPCILRRLGGFFRRLLGREEEYPVTNPTHPSLASIDSGYDADEESGPGDVLAANDSIRLR